MSSYNNYEAAIAHKMGEVLGVKPKMSKSQLRLAKMLDQSANALRFLGSAEERHINGNRKEKIPPCPLCAAGQKCQARKSCRKDDKPARRVQKVMSKSLQT